MVTSRAPDSFEAAYPSLFVRAAKVAYRLLGDGAAAEDVAAEALARAYAPPSTPTTSTTPSSTTPSSTPPTSTPHTATTPPPVAMTTVSATTTTTSPQPPACPLAGFATVTNQSSYVVGAQVFVTLQVTNTSDQPCTGPFLARLGAFGTITQGGVVVATTQGPAVSCTSPCVPPVIAPGASLPYDAGSWVATAAGSYTAQARVGSAGTPVNFTVTSA